MQIVLVGQLVTCFATVTVYFCSATELLYRTVPIHKSYERMKLKLLELLALHVLFFFLTAEEHGEFYNATIMQVHLIDIYNFLQENRKF